MAIQLEINSNITNNSRLKHKFKGDNQSMYVVGTKIERESKNINNQINTTGNSCAGRVSFAGDAKTEAGSKVIQAIVKNKWFEKFCNLSGSNPAIAEALGALVITCGMRPLAILAMPQKDADKNRKAASHSIASGITGYIFARIAYEPFSVAMKKISDSPGKYLSKKGKYLLDAGRKDAKTGITKTNMDCFNLFVTYGPKVVTAPILAAFTVGTMPYIDRYVIDKYILKQPPKQDDKPIFTTYDHFKYLTFKSGTTKSQKVFSKFTGAMKDENVDSSMTHRPAFGAAVSKKTFNIVPKFVRDLYDKGVDKLAHGIGKFSENKYVKELTQWCVNNKIDYTNHLSALCANILNGFYMYNVATSKKIEPEQKKPLMLNMFIGTVLSTIGGYALNGAIDRKLRPFDALIRKEYGGNAENLEKILKGFRIAKSLMVFQLLYRFICPVVATPIANHISNKVRDKKAGDKGSLAV